MHVAVIVAGVLALHVFYRAIQTNWPLLYMSAADFTGQFVSSSVIRYSAYRVIPVCAVTFFVAGSLRTASQPELLTALTVAILHVSLTNGVAAWRAIFAGRDKFGFLSNVIFHGVAGAAAIVSAFAAVIIARTNWAILLLPTPSELSTALWTAVAAAILGAYIVRVSSAPYRDPIQASRASIPDDLWVAARSYALANQADPALVKSIMVVENLQRPRWLRRLEAVKARLGFEGTYGIMQVSLRAAVNDERSIQIACEGHLYGARPRRGRHGVEYESIREIARRHNDDPAFIEFVAHAFPALDSEEAKFRATIAMHRTDGGAVVAMNTGGGPARDLVVFRILVEEKSAKFSRSSYVQISPNEEMQIDAFESVEFEDVPETTRWELPVIRHENDWVIRAVWVNEDLSEGDSGWSIAALSRGNTQTSRSPTTSPARAPSSGTFA